MSSVTTLKLKGPYSFVGENSISAVLQDNTNGVHLWTIGLSKDVYRV